MYAQKNILPERLTKLRKEHNLSQYTLSEKIGFSRGLIANYEQGRREPDYNTLLTFANFYQVSMDYLLGRTDEKNAIYSQTKLSSDLIDTINGLRSETLEELEQYINLLKLRDSLPPENTKKSSALEKTN